MFACLMLPRFRFSSFLLIDSESTTRKVIHHYRRGEEMGVVSQCDNLILLAEHAEASSLHYGRIGLIEKVLHVDFLTCL